jgi:hypothetical protein
MPPDATGMTPASEAQSCSKYSPCSGIGRQLVGAQRGVEALHAVGVALQLADDGAGVDVVDAGQPHPFADDAEAHAVASSGVCRCRDRRGAGAASTPFLRAHLAHRLDGGVADHQVDHDDHAAQFLGKLGALVHVLHRAGGDIEVVALDLAGGMPGRG